MLKLINTLLAAGTLLCATIATAHADTLEEIRARGQINVAILVDFPPFGLLNEQNQPDGYDFDVATKLAEDLGVTLNLVQTTGPNRIPFLLGGRADIIIATLSMTEERAKQVAFTRPYAALHTVVYGLKDVDISEPEALAGKTIGVLRAATQDTAVTTMAPVGTDIRRFEDNSSVIQALLSGQIQSMADANTVIAEVEKVSGGRFETKFTIAQQLQAMAVRPDDVALRDYVNDFIERQVADGTLEALTKEWFGTELPESVRNPS